MKTLEEILNSDQLIEEMYQKANSELINFGVKMLFKEMGFTISDHSQTPIIRSDSDFNSEVFNKFLDPETLKEFEIIKAKVNSRIRYKLKHNLHKILNEEYITNTVQSLTDEILQYSTNQLLYEMRIKLDRNYRALIMERLESGVLGDPKIKALMLHKL